jgi:hypothetical protein
MLLSSIVALWPCTSIFCLHSTTPTKLLMAFTKLLMALDLNLPPDEGDREDLPNLNGVVDEAPYLGGDGVQQDHLQRGGNPEIRGEGDIHEGGNPADGVQGDVLGGNPVIQGQSDEDLGGGNQVVRNQKSFPYSTLSDLK